jgi:DNA polymerase-4
MPTRALWGIGPATAQRLAQLNIHTIGELAQADVSTLRQHFGNQGSIMGQRALGIDPRPVCDEPGVAKSISQERTYSRDVADSAFLKKELWRMCQELARSLDEAGLVARTVGVKFRRADFSTFTRQKTGPTPLAAAEDIYRQALLLWQEHWPAGRPMRLLGVAVTGLEEGSRRQLPLLF